MICSICKNPQLRLYYTQGNEDQFKYYRCTKCKGVIYDLTRGLDQGKYGTEYSDPFDDSLKKNIAQDVSYRFISKKLGKYKGTMLDIGCGNGRLLANAKADGWQVKGLEFSPLNAKSIQELLGIEVAIHDFLKYDRNGETFDLVVMRHVLEHLPDPILALNKTGELLKPGGYALFEFPNIESIGLKFNRFMKKFKHFRKKYRKDYIPGHCVEYSRKSFKYLAELTGFKIRHWETYSHKKFPSLIYKHIKIGSKARALIQKR